MTELTPPDLFGQNNNNNNSSSPQFPPIKEFYTGAEIFITGGTGFLGKTLIEKLIRCCEGINNIYVLIRSKRDLTCEERWKEFLTNPIFDRVRQKNPSLLNKLVCITGDISAPKLGMDDIDSENLAEKVNIVFHAAATIRFDEDLKLAARLNTLGTKKLLDFCTTLTHLKSVVHVSTAYSNPTRKDVDEVVYPTEPIDKDSFLKCFNEFADETLDYMGKTLQGSHPNTYTLTKSMAESIVSDYSLKMPICIVRPSIITGAIQEPFPGWVDNVSGVTGIIIEIARGMLHSIIAENNAHMDVIPVDIVVNTILTAAWANAFLQPNRIQVYNCTSGQINGIKWRDYGRLTQKYARLNPTKYVMLYPNFTFRTNYTVHKFYEVIFQFLPSYFFDIMMRMQGAKPVMMKIANKIARNAKIGEFFALRDYNFENKNMRTLSAAVKWTKDGAEFNCDVSGMDWERYVQTFLYGIRRFILQDDMESMKAARRKIRTLFWIRNVFHLGLLWLLIRYPCWSVMKFMNARNMIRR